MGYIREHGPSISQWIAEQFSSSFFTPYLIVYVDNRSSTRLLVYPLSYYARPHNNHFCPIEFKWRSCEPRYLLVLSCGSSAKTSHHDSKKRSKFNSLVKKRSCNQKVIVLLLLFTILLDNFDKVYIAAEPSNTTYIESCIKRNQEWPSPLMHFFSFPVCTLPCSYF